MVDFAVVVGLIWIGWFNGAQFHELHGREDGRNRSFIFLQMGILTVLAVFTGHAASTDGEPFALTYAVLLAVLVWQWASVYRTDSPEYRPGAFHYLAGLVVAIGALLASAAMEETRGWQCGPPSSSARSGSLSCTCCVRPTWSFAFTRAVRTMRDAPEPG